MVWKAQDFCYIFKAPVKDVKKKKPTTQQRKFLKYTDNVVYNLFSLLKKETHAGNILKPSK